MVGLLVITPQISNRRGSKLPSVSNIRGSKLLRIEKTKFGPVTLKYMFPELDIPIPGRSGPPLSLKQHTQLPEVQSTFI